MKHDDSNDVPVSLKIAPIYVRRQPPRCLFTYIGGKKTRKQEVIKNHSLWARNK